MAQPSLQSKLEYAVEYKASAEKVFDFWTLKQGDIPKASPEFVQKIELLEGTWETEGCITEWTYNMGGRCRLGMIELLEGTWETEGCITEWTYNMGGENNLSSKAISEKLDFEKKVCIFKITDGDILGAHYRSFKIIGQMTPKDDGGSVASWTFEYEKVNENAADPIVNRDASILVNKAIDAYLSQA